MNIETKLIIVEGIMGSGKSTTGHLIGKFLRDRGTEAQFLWEDDARIKVTDDLPSEFRPWDSVSVVEYMERSRNKWTTFVEQVLECSAIAVLDGQLFHGDLTNLMMMEATREQLQSQVRQITEITRPLRPAVIYITQADIRQAMNKVFTERGKDWEKYQVDWKTASPYCVARNLDGYEGLVKMYENYRDLCDALFAELDMQKVNIENSVGDWPRHQSDICQFLGFPESRLSQSIS